MKIHLAYILCQLQSTNDNLNIFLTVLPHFTDWNVLEFRSNRKSDAQFFKSFSEQVFRSYNMKTKHNEPALRPGTAMNGDRSTGSLIGGPTLQNLDLSCICNSQSQKLLIKINQELHPSDEIKIKLKRGELEYVGVIQIPSDSPDLSEGVSIEAPIKSAHLIPQVLRHEVDPIDAMIQVNINFSIQLNYQSRSIWTRRDA